MWIFFQFFFFSQKNFFHKIIFFIQNQVRKKFQNVLFFFFFKFFKAFFQENRSHFGGVTLNDKPQKAFRSLKLQVKSIEEITYSCKKKKKKNWCEWAYVTLVIYGTSQSTSDQNDTKNKILDSIQNHYFSNWNWNKIIFNNPKTFMIMKNTKKLKKKKKIYKKTHTYENSNLG